MLNNDELSLIMDNEIPKYLEDIQNNTPWDFLNEVLYNLCKKNPEHDDAKIILSKTLIIGRVYAAALERNAIKKKNRETVVALTDEIESSLGDDFYLEQVVPRFKSFFNREEIKALLNNISDKLSRRDALQLQSKFATEIKELKKGGKTSFSSKYLHFHFPNQFYIYDSRAQKALPYLKLYIESKLGKNITYNMCALHENEIQDKNIEYIEFENKCHALKHELARMKINCTNRQFDRVLLLIANSIIRYETKRKRQSKSV